MLLRNILCITGDPVIQTLDDLGSDQWRRICLPE